MKSKTFYVYKVKHGFLKKKDDTIKLFDVGFSLFKTEDGEEEIYALPFALKRDSVLVKKIITTIEHLYEKATTEEREKDFTDFKFERVLNEDQTESEKLVVTDELYDEFTKAQICLGESGLLFINTGIAMYFNAEVLSNEAPDIVNYLIEHKVIYRKKARAK